MLDTLQSTAEIACEELLALLASDRLIRPGHGCAAFDEVRHVSSFLSTRSGPTIDPDLPFGPTTVKGAAAATSSEV